jgi:signal transduction histidine kinase
MPHRFQLSDRFLPAGVTEPMEVQRYRAAVIQSWLGVGLTVFFGGLYAVMGSPLSGAAILVIAAGLAVTPTAIRRGVSATQLGNAMIALTWFATFVVTLRSGGFSSPALVWNFLLPLCTYSVCGRSSAMVWSALAMLQISGFFIADVLGVQFPSDFSASVLSILRISGYWGFVFAVAAVLVVVDNVRQAAMKAQEQANRLVEHERLVADIHDGIGSQLGVLVALAGNGQLGQQQLVADLSACLDDLRLIVDSLDQEERSLDFALGELRARIQPRCEALGIQLEWEVAAPGVEWPPAVVLQVLRSGQELLSNALRHAHAKRVTLSFGECTQSPGWVKLTVEDDGRGSGTVEPGSRGRGLNNLRARAQRLGGNFAFELNALGARAVLAFPHPSPR